MDPTSFAEAATAVVDGRRERLESLLEAHPGLIQARSEDAFRATLLHHVAANGIPDALQRTPPNAVEIARLLLESGAEANATCEAYGGGPRTTPLCLLVSSQHPSDAGLQGPLVEALAAGGAAVDGIEDDGAPLTTALVFGYTDAARALRAAGARVDRLFQAAGLGELEEVEGRIDGATADQVQEAFHVALTHGQIGVASLLLERGAEVDGRTPGQHCELPLLQTVFVHEPAAAAWLVERGADPDLRCGKRGESAREHALASGDARWRALFDRCP